MSTEHNLARLPEFVLGTLPPAEMAEMQAWVEAHPEVWPQVGELEEALASLALAEAPVAPSTGARDRLLSSVEARPRLEGFTARVARFLDVGAEAARRILSLLDDAAAWLATPLAGVTLLDVEGGPAVAGARVGLLRVAPGVTFPHHSHFGDERVLILQGGYRDDRGRVFGPGDIDENAADSAHEFTALEGPDMVFVVVLYKGISLPDFE